MKYCGFVTFCCPVLSRPGYTFFILGIAISSNPWADFNGLWLKMIIIHGHVPDDFGKGIVIPLVKDKAGDLSDPDNYRGITISPTISKVFEICLLDKCAHFIQSRDLQLGFKKCKSCSVPIFCVQHVVNITLLTMVAMYTWHMCVCVCVCRCVCVCVHH